tara:strand:+ start:444 stop:671 length:228 start_codon:yes stop_codon:yes gene_type:complete
MPGHSTLSDLGNPQVSPEGFSGRFLLIKGSAPDGNDTGYGKGALAINTAGNSTSTHWYVNLGDDATPTWTALTIA